MKVFKLATAMTLALTLSAQADGPNGRLPARRRIRYRRKLSQPAPRSQRHRIKKPWARHPTRHARGLRCRCLRVPRLAQRWIGRRMRCRTVHLREHLQLSPRHLLFPEGRMKMKTLMIGTAMLGVMIATGAYAGDNSITGVVLVGTNNRSTISDSVGNTRWFITNSKDGQRILRECPNGVTYTVEMALPRSGNMDDIDVVNKPMRDIFRVRRLPLN
jgi:hypothetical protein